MTERLGFPSVFRSDHYFIRQQKESLEPYLSFVMAAQQTTRLRFGPLVTPVTFRPPALVARMAAQIDELSGGRFVLGLGAGWYEAEHQAYGAPFPPVKERMDRLEEALRVVRTVWGPGPASYEGEYYQVHNIDCLPKPANPRLPLLIGGAGERRTLRIVAEHADEWNCFNQTPDAYRAKRAVLEEHCQAVGRDPSTIKRSMMLFAFLGATEQEVLGQARRFLGDAELSGDALRARAKERGWLVGTTQETVDYLGQLAALGVQEVQLQHLDFSRDDVLEYFAGELRPRVAGL